MRALATLVAMVWVCCFSPSALARSPAVTTEGTWVPLFNGKDLSGWTVKITGFEVGKDPFQTFRVEDGLLKVRYDRYENFAGQFGHLFWSQPLSHYALHIEYRFVGEQVQGGPAGWAVRNSGAMLHAQGPDEMGLAQDFPWSIEAQFLGGLDDGRARPTANVCTPGTDITVEGQTYQKHCLNSSSATYDGDQWVDVTVVVLGGGRITHYVSGEEVLSYERPVLSEVTSHTRQGAQPKLLYQGYIALQSESHPVDFRQIRLLNLTGCTDPKAKNYAAYFINSDPNACQY